MLWQPQSATQVQGSPLMHTTMFPLPVTSDYLVYTLRVHTAMYTLSLHTACNKANSGQLHCFQPGYLNKYIAVAGGLLGMLP